MKKYHPLRLILFSSLLFLSITFIAPLPANASSIIGEPCSVHWVDKSVDGWPFIINTWLDSCPISCPQDVAGDFNNQSDVWCADLTPPPNMPGIYLGNACSASDSRTVTLLTDGTFGTNFDIQANGQIINGNNHTFTTIPEGEFSAVAQAHNSKGSSGWSAPAIAQHDYSSPNTTPDIVGITHNDWYISPVSVTFNAIDVGCFGVAQTVYSVNGVADNYTGTPVMVMVDGVNTLQYRSTDGYHLEDEKSVNIPMDTTPPTLQFTLDRPYDAGNWWNAPLHITISADDATSGVAYLEHNLNGGGWISGNSLILTDGIHSLDAQVTDNAGHLTYDGIVIQIDSLPPTLTISLDGGNGENGWFITPPSVSFSAMDATSGIAGILYQVENGNQTLYNTPLTFTREGLYTLQAFGVDYAQNITTQTFQVAYDMTPPQTTATLSETDNGMVITLNRWDGVSGFALTRIAINGVWGDYHAPVTVSDVGEYWIQYFTTDFAGNIEAEKITSFTISEAGVIITQNPRVVNIVPPANPPNTPPFETRDDFPPDLHDESVYYVSPPPNKPPFETADDFPPNLHDESVYYASSPTNETTDIKPLPRSLPDDELPFMQSVPQLNRLSNPARPIPMEYVEHPVAFVPSVTTSVIYAPQSQTTQPSSPLDVTMLAMMGLTLAGAGMMKTQTSIAKKQEQQAQNVQALAQLQAQQSAQKQAAQANWAENQAMQASAKQAVVTQVIQSQANKDFWAAYAEWQLKVAEAEQKRREQLQVSYQIKRIEDLPIELQNLFWRLGNMHFAKDNHGNDLFNKNTRAELGYYQYLIRQAINQGDLSALSNHLKNAQQYSTDTWAAYVEDNLNQTRQQVTQTIFIRQNDALTRLNPDSYGFYDNPSRRFYTDALSEQRSLLQEGKQEITIALKQKGDVLKSELNETWAHQIVDIKVGEITQLAHNDITRNALQILSNQIKSMSMTNVIIPPSGVEFVGDFNEVLQISQLQNFDVMRESDKSQLRIEYPNISNNSDFNSCGQTTIAWVLRSLGFLDIHPSGVYYFSIMNSNLNFSPFDPTNPQQIIQLANTLRPNVWWSRTFDYQINLDLINGQTMIDEIKNDIDLGYVPVMQVYITSEGILTLKDVSDTPHWVGVSRISTEGGWIEIYNPFSNSFEYYSTSYLRSSLTDQGETYIAFQRNE